MLPAKDVQWVAPRTPPRIHHDLDHARLMVRTPPRIRPQYPIALLDGHGKKAEYEPTGRGMTGRNGGIGSYGASAIVASFPVLTARLSAECLASGTVIRAAQSVPLQVVIIDGHAARPPCTSRPLPRLAESWSRARSTTTLRVPPIASPRGIQRARVRLPARPHNLQLEKAASLAERPAWHSRRCSYITHTLVAIAYPARPPCQAKQVHASALDARCALRMAPRRGSAVAPKTPRALRGIVSAVIRTARVRDAHALPPSQAARLVERSARRAWRAGADVNAIALRACSDAGFALRAMSRRK
ncbi:hypothetical protein K438DRAFT_1979303 [Mycena galopus ATCC 62051]|nr:hypothetical protein K438DRAFT_1979303 [Mycena galopus ATCC 62051]